MIMVLGLAVVLLEAFISLRIFWKRFSVGQGLGFRVIAATAWTLFLAAIPLCAAIGLLTAITLHDPAYVPDVVFAAQALFTALFVLVVILFLLTREFRANEKHRAVI